mgnify:CR=1 FL=1
MKKILFILISITLVTPVYADKLLKDGFLNNKMNYAKNQNIIDPKNKIILIYNHGQDDHDDPSNNCVWKNGIRNFSSLVGEKINGKEIMLYLLCTNHLAGDDYKRLWKKKKFKPPYKGITKLDKRVKANLELIDQFLEMGVPKKQIILLGHSCGGWMTLMLLAKYPDKVVFKCGCGKSHIVNDPSNRVFSVAVPVKFVIDCENGYVTFFQVKGFFKQTVTTFWSTKATVFTKALERLGL